MYILVFILIIQQKRAILYLTHDYQYHNKVDIRLAIVPILDVIIDGIPYIIQYILYNASYKINLIQCILYNASVIMSMSKSHYKSILNALSTEPTIKAQ